MKTARAMPSHGFPSGLSGESSPSGMTPTADPEQGEAAGTAGMRIGARPVHLTSHGQLQPENRRVELQRAAEVSDVQMGFEEAEHYGDLVTGSIVVPQSPTRVSAGGQVPVRSISSDSTSGFLHRGGVNGSPQ